MWKSRCWLWLWMLLTLPMSAVGQGILPGNKIKKNADGILSIMAFSVVPDLTSSFLSIDDSQVGSNRLFMTQFAGGDTVSKKTPIYLEGSIALSRFDPTYVETMGQEARRLPARWNSIAGTAGIGYDIPLTSELVLRPIFNFSLGHLESDLTLASRYLGNKLDTDAFDFLKYGKLNAYGLGGSIMLDYTLVKPQYEVDLELRYTHIQLRSFDSSAAVKGNATAEAASFYARYRAPTGLTVMDRPLRYVLEAANTVYLGGQRGLLGFNNLSSVGVGVEFDSSKYDIMVSRTRLVARYAFGQNVRGFALGLAVSF